ncbi:hypothetical protein CLF_113060, partial [Clonorchis sinensis]
VESNSTHAHMESDWLERRISILKGLHTSFIVTLLATGIVGLTIFGYIVNQPMRTCPVIYALYITFWLCLGLSVLQVVLGLGFLIWFLVSLYNYSGPLAAAYSSSKTEDHAPTQYSTSRAGAATLDQPRRPSSRLSTISSMSSLHLTNNRVRKLSNWKTVRSVRRCRPHVGWLCVGGVFLALLSAGLILGLVLVVGHINYFYTTFSTDLTSVFIEARVGFHSPEDPQGPNNALLCWDKLQRNGKCCGLHNYTDWLDRSVAVAGELVLPNSCVCTSCTGPFPPHITASSVGYVYVSGCRSAIESNVLFSLAATRLYLALALGLVVITFIVDFVYTLVTAHTALSRSHQATVEPGRQLSVPALNPQGRR